MALHTAHVNPARVLLVEDSLSIAAMYRHALETEGYSVEQAGTLAQARKSAAGGGFTAALLDLGLPDGDGLDLLHEWHRSRARMSVIVVTANASINKAVQAVREGAFDYLVKPLASERLIATLKNAVQQHGAPAREPDAGDLGFIGASAPMQEVYRKLRSFAGSRAPVFITGESGTGKELCAEAIHRLSARREGPFIALNCAAIPRELMESEIFGHLKGSFTGAVADRAGAAGQARGGTLFLDEVCELDPALQTKLLRFLQTGTIQRVGAASSEQVDVRIVCATNRTPLEEVRRGRFRDDLFYRLHVLAVHLPPLRERGRDVLVLANRFLADYAGEEGKAFTRLEPSAETALLAHDWPGNVRELQNVVRQAVVLHDGDAVRAEMLGIAQPARPHVDDPRERESLAGTVGSSGRALGEIERQAIETAIATCGGSIPKAAKVLGVSPSTIYRKREAWRTVPA
ncbi:MAG: sigma-54-dependent transcriptional regulator [Parvibaculaceae bacterium]